MGLDITAYSKIVSDPNITDVEQAYEAEKSAYVDQSTINWVEKEWPGRTEGLRAGGYTYADTHGFRAGSYGGYSLWRSQLATYAHGKTSQQIWDSGMTVGAFMELIHFADNEGYIGPVVAKKLLNDFEIQRESIMQKVPADDEWFRLKYQDWTKAFALAADGGFVDFH